MGGTPAPAQVGKAPVCVPEHLCVHLCAPQHLCEHLCAPEHLCVPLIPAAHPQLTLRALLGKAAGPWGIRNPEKAEIKQKPLSEMGPGQGRAQSQRKGNRGRGFDMSPKVLWALFPLLTHPKGCVEPFPPPGGSPGLRALLHIPPSWGWQEGCRKTGINPRKRLEQLHREQ